MKYRGIVVSVSAYPYPILLQHSLLLVARLAEPTTRIHGDRRNEIGRKFSTISPNPASPRWSIKDLQPKTGVSEEGEEKKNSEGRGDTNKSLGPTHTWARPNMKRAHRPKDELTVLFLILPLIFFFDARGPLIGVVMAFVPQLAGRVHRRRGRRRVCMGNVQCVQCQVINKAAPNFTLLKQDGFKKIYGFLYHR
jgi:hypothetical protein